MVAFRIRRFWLERLAAAWRGKSVIWLSVVAADVVKSFVEKHAGLRVEFVGLEALIRRLEGRGRAAPR